MTAFEWLSFLDNSLNPSCITLCNPLMTCKGKKKHLQCRLFCTKVLKYHKYQKDQLESAIPVSIDM